MTTETKRKGGIFYGWWVVLSLSAVYGFSAILHYSTSLFFPFMQAEMGWTSADLGNVFAVYMWIMLGYGMLAGWLTDRFGGRFVIMSGAVIGCIGGVLLSTVQTVTQVLIYYSLIVALGVSMQLFIPTLAVNRKWFMKRAGFTAGLIAALFGVISATLFPVLGRTAATVGWRPTLMWTAICVEVTIIVLSIFVIRSTPESMGLNVDGMSDQEAAAIREAIGKTLQAEPHMTRAEALRAPQFWLAAIAFAVVGAVLSGFLGHIMMIAVGVGIAPAAAGTLMSAWALPSILGRVAGGWLGDRFGKRPIFIIFGLLCAAVFVYGWLFVKTPTTAYIFAVSGGLVMMTSTVLLAPFFGDMFGRIYLGSIMGISGLVSGVVGGLGPLVAGRIAEATGAYNLFFLIAAACYGVLVLVVFFIRPTRVELQTIMKKKE